MQRIDISRFSEVVEGMRQPYHDNYLAMYSSVYGGIVRDPAIMLVPIDDHMVHRGDAVFDTCKSVAGKVYNLKAHLERLEKAAEEIELTLPVSVDEIERIVVETLRAGGERDCLVRVLVSRGPGSLGVDARDCPRSALYVLVTKGKKSFMDDHPEGATVKASSIPAKPPFMATVKSCNYVPNVLMKMEAVEAGVDFVAGFDERGHLTEGATENIGIVTTDGGLCFPRLDGILRGTTMMRVAELAENLVKSGELKSVEFGDIPRKAVLDAGEIIVVGTTSDVTMVREFDCKVVGDGRPGPVYGRLRVLLLEDMRQNSEVLTPVFDE